MDQARPPRPRPIQEVRAVPAAVPTPATKPKPPKKKRLRSRKLRAGLVVLAVLLLAGFAVAYMRTRNSIKDEGASLSKTVGKYLEVPTDETPTVATVNDAGKLQGQTLFSNAQNGDKILIYSKAGKAVIYRPSAKRVVEFSRITLGTSAAPQR